MTLFFWHWRYFFVVDIYLMSLTNTFFQWQFFLSLTIFICRWHLFNVSDKYVLSLRVDRPLYVPPDANHKDTIVSVKKRFKSILYILRRKRFRILFGASRRVLCVGSSTIYYPILVDVYITPHTIPLPLPLPHIILGSREHTNFMRIFWFLKCMRMNW